MRPVKSVLAALIVLAAAAVVYWYMPRNNEFEQIPVKIAITSWPGYAAAFLAQEKGMFAKNGVQVELVRRATPKGMIEAYQYGEVDGTFSVCPDVVLLRAQGFSGKIVCVIDRSETTDVLVARPPIVSPADLKGKVVSFTGVNSFSHLFVIELLKKYGLSEIDVRFEDVSDRMFFWRLKPITLMPGIPGNQ